MTCVHLKLLHELHQEHKEQLSLNALIVTMCDQCEEREHCPVVLTGLPYEDGFGDDPGGQGA